MDATASMSGARGQHGLKFCGRLFLMLPGQCFLIIDRVEMRHFGLVESRLHTCTDVKVARAGAKLTGQRHRLRIAYACDVPAVLCGSRMAPATPEAGPEVLRWCTASCAQKAVTMVTLLSPGAGAARVELGREDRNLVIRVVRAGRARRVVVTRRLRRPVGKRR